MLGIRRTYSYITPGSPRGHFPLNAKKDSRVWYYILLFLDLFTHTRVEFDLWWKVYWMEFGIILSTPVVFALVKVMVLVQQLLLGTLVPRNDGTRLVDVIFVGRSYQSWQIIVTPNWPNPTQFLDYISHVSGVFHYQAVVYWSMLKY